MKEKTECTPTGYYLLPIYDKGEYRLTIEGPLGWSFEPKEYQIVVNEGDNECNGGKDLNFVFTGFSLSGKVKGKGCQEEGGPSGVIVSLRSADPKLGVTRRATLKNGEFLFENILPSSYYLSLTHSHWQFEKVSFSLPLSSLSMFFILLFFWASKEGDEGGDAMGKHFYGRRFCSEGLQNKWFNLV